MISQEALNHMVEAVNRQEGWSPPQLLRDTKTSLSSRFPHEKGLLRIGIRGGETTAQVFLGEGNILDRVSALQNVYGEKRPGRTPHTASPHLWERRRLSSGTLHYEVSFLPLGAFTESWRKGLACLAITRHRLQFRRSPFANFGAMPANESESLPPCFDELIWEDPLNLLWAGLHWSSWVGVQQLKGVETPGLYRLRLGNELLFIGQGKIWDRVRPYRANTALSCSYVCKEQWSRRHRLELVNDCIASCVFSASALPPAQFSEEAEKKRYQREVPFSDDPSTSSGTDRLLLSFKQVVTLLRQAPSRPGSNLAAHLLSAS